MGKMKDKDNELLPGLIEAYGTYRTVKPYLHNISKCYERNILNLKLVLCRLKHKASTVQLSVTDFLERSGFTAAINVTFFLFVICVVFSGKFIIFNFCCFFMFLTYRMLSATVVFSHFSFPFHGPLKCDGLRFQYSS